MRDDQEPESIGTDCVDLGRREVLASLAKYSAVVAGASTVVLTASSSVSLASVSGAGGDRGGRKPGSGKPVGKAPSSGTREQVSSGRNE